MYTGYDDSGAYCQEASTELDDDAHLLLYSGRLGVVVDAAGLYGGSRNLLPRMGSTAALSASASARDVYDALPAVEANITFETTCTDGTAETYVLGTSEDQFVQIGLVRQGHAVTQIIVTALEWQDPTTGDTYGPCNSFVAEKDPDGTNCNGYANWPCPDDYPDCVGFVQGSSWGKCYTVCTDTSVPELWLEVSMWGDSIALQLAWDGNYSLSSDCSGAITLNISGDVPFSSTTALLNSSGGDVLAFVAGSGGAISIDDETPEYQVIVTSSSGTVYSRNATRDVFVEVPSTECLKDTIARVMPFWEEAIVPDLRVGKTVFVAAHGNSIRAILKFLEGISDEDITGLEIPTGTPLVYALDADLKPMPCELAVPPLRFGRYLGDAEAIKAAAEAVKNQTKVG
eukprot:NODE_556_length_1482_cov_232.718991.p1 GENE.NODE_556_length_1482_cov_232.718991~~NODE_556_length_1482_cov_232.718991.p1  ORF type:complete len:400 (-),score=97.21 NODE_556_length_1482_cov_232.718991:176-1375(-)